MSRSSYDRQVPKLWNETIDEHRREVRDAILDTTVALVSEHGILSVTMSRIAEETGIGRATLYKYFPDVEAILREWHERKIAAHLGQLEEALDQAPGPSERLATVLQTYALMAHGTRGHADTELAALLHRDKHVADAEQHLTQMVCDLLVDGVQAGEVRDDVPPTELASYCLHALTGVGRLPSKAAVRRLVLVTLAGLRPQS